MSLRIKAWPHSLVLAMLFLVVGTRAVYAQASSGEGEFFVTGYTCSPCDPTATGTRARVGIVAVDPKVIPLGSIVEIENKGTFIAEDTGGGVKGQMVDFFVPSVAAAYALTGNYNVRWYPANARQRDTPRHLQGTSNAHRSPTQTTMPSPL